jgi:hypothetical protein
VSFQILSKLFPPASLRGTSAKCNQ